MNIFRYFIGEARLQGVPLVLKRDIFGAAIGASAQLQSDIFNWYNTKQTNASNLEIANANNRTAVELSRENNAFQERMNNANNRFAAEQAEIQRQYDSAEQQVARLKAAGINPAVVFGQGSGSAGSASLATPHGSGVSPQLPSLATPHMESFQMVSPAAALRDIGQAFQALSNSDKTNEDVDILRKAKDDILRKYSADASLAEAESIIKNYYGMREASANVTRIKNEATKAFYSALLLQKQGNTEEARKELVRAQTFAEKESAKLRSSERKKVDNENSVFFKLANGQLDALKASAEQSRATAANQRSQSALTDENTWREKLKNAILDSNNIYDHQRIENAVLGEFEAAAKRNELSDQEIKKIKDTLPSLVEQMKNDAAKGKPWSLEYFVDRVLNVVTNTAGNAALLLIK